MQIKDILEANNWENGQPFYSEHDLEMIAELRRLGIYILMARKGVVKNGILKLKEFKVYYTRRSINLHMERQRYKWAYVGDTATGQPDKGPDHLMDAIRYAVYTHMFGD